MNRHSRIDEQNFCSSVLCKSANDFGWHAQSDSDGRVASRQPSRCARGFSLLEMMIVLVLMVGLLAIAWPNMQRPLRRTTLNEAAQTLREAIDEGRNQAITTGSPVFVQMQHGNHEVRTGSFANFANEDSADNSLGALSNHHTMPTTLATASPHGLGMELRVDDGSPRTWRLPESVVIAEVSWTLEPSIEHENEEILASTEATTSHVYGASEQSHENANHKTEVSTFAISETNADWWLPISATGQSRDASIVLLDTSSNETMTVTYASATGALEIVR